MSGEFHHEKIVTAAKPHACEICCQAINKGDKYTRIKSKSWDADTPDTWKYHPDCRSEEVRVNRRDSYRDEWSELGEWVDESGYHPDELGLSKSVTKRLIKRRQQIDARNRKHMRDYWQARRSPMVRSIFFRGYRIADFLRPAAEAMLRWPVLRRMVRMRKKMAHGRRFR